jgi:hypothetical protein
MTFIRGLLAAAIFAASAAAGAATVTIDWYSPVFDPGHVNIGTVTYPDGSNGADAGRFAGEVTEHEEMNDEDFIASLEKFYAYCYDLAQWLSSSKYQVQTGADADVLNFLGAVNAALGGDPYAWLHPADKRVAAAVQLGIWEGLYEAGTFDLAAGNVKYQSVPDNVKTHYNAFIALLNTTDSLDGNLVMRLTNVDTQDVITGRRVPDRLIPEPGTILLIGLGAAAAAFGRRRDR